MYVHSADFQGDVCVNVRSQTVFFQGVRCINVRSQCSLSGWSLYKCTFTVQFVRVVVI